VTVAQNTATFSFNSPNEPAATFECRLDSNAEVDFQPCTSPRTLNNLSEGAHVFEVRAVDPNTNRDPSPARGVFTVDTTPPPVGGSGGVAGQVSDALRGACDNRIRGNKQANDLNGTRGGDRILAFGADDSLRGRGGFDCLKGHKGNDELTGGVAGDILQGGPGDDTHNARDGKRDKVNCGPGDDVALVDQRDVVKGCETLRVRMQRSIG
jgi:Ca2+-binding RTX toxin-like protein